MQSCLKKLAVSLGFQSLILLCGPVLFVDIMRSRRLEVSLRPAEVLSADVGVGTFGWIWTELVSHTCYTGQAQIHKFFEKNKNNHLDLLVNV